MTVDSRIRLWRAANDYITLDYARATVSYLEQGERIRDRLGLLHRIVPAAERYPAVLGIALLPEELTRLNNPQAPTRRNLIEWLELWFQVHAELVVYVRGETLDDEGGALTRQLAYKAVLDELPREYFVTLPVIAGGPEYAELSLTITEDGSFSDFDALGSYTPRVRP